MDQFFHRPELLLVVVLQLPVVILERLILISHQHIAALTLLQDLPLGGLIEPGIDLPLIIEMDSGKRCLNFPRRDLHRSTDRRCIFKHRIALGRNVFSPCKIVALCGLLHMFQSTALCQRYKAGHGLSVGVPDNGSAHLFGDTVHIVLFRIRSIAKEFFVFRLGILVHFPDRGAGENIMELIAHQNLPVFLKIRIVSQAKLPGHDGFRFQIGQSKLASAVPFLVPGHGGIGSAVEFQIQLTGPNGSLLPSKIPFQVLEEF